MTDPNQRYQIDPTSMAASPLPLFSATTAPMAQMPQGQTVQTLTQIIDTRQILNEILRKVEGLEQRKPVQRSVNDVSTSAKDERTIAHLAGQMEQMAKDQAEHFASTKQVVIDILRAQQHVGMEITKINESSRYGIYHINGRQ